jgi:hypothetical protein
MMQFSSAQFLLKNICYFSRKIKYQQKIANLAHQGERNIGLLREEITSEEAQVGIVGNFR